MTQAILLAFALAMDATAVGLTRGLIGARREIFLVPLLFGGFQAGMAAVGLALGHAGQGFVGNAKLWIAAGLLLLLGVRMVLGGWRSKGEDAELGEPGAAGEPATADIANASLITLLTLSFVTSIDAAAAGATLPTLSVTPTISLGLIGVVTLVCSAAAVLAGRQLRLRAANSQQHWFEVAGGVVLIGLAIKTAYDAINL